MRVLVVDDDKLNLKFADGYLKTYFNDYTGILCQRPQDVIGILETEAIDILLLDIIMPEMSGIEVLRNVRDIDAFNDIQIIMLTSLDDKESLKSCFEYGANDYIQKPIEIIEFKARVSAAARTRANTRMLREMLEVVKGQNEELKIANKLLEDAQFHLVQSRKMSNIGEIAAGIGYEINQPIEKAYLNLQQLANYCEKVKKGEFEEGNFEEVRLIIDSSKDSLEKVSQIIQSLLNLSWAKAKNEYDICDIESLINQIIIVIANEAKDSVDITKEIDKLPEIWANSSQLGQVFLNVMLNGIEAIRKQYREDRGHIHINAYKESEYVCIRISDNGPGINNENLEKIFNPLYTTKASQRGTGLGLSISYDIIVNKHGGEIEAQSEENQGSSFLIRLPIKKG